jgi:Zn ribbon nucleic-acid-binding protein
VEQYRLVTARCSKCSTDKEEKREIEFKNHVVTCLRCGHKQEQIPDPVDGPFYKLKEFEEEEDDGRRG